jgi:hypothetical protein
MERKVIEVIERDVCKFFNIDEESLFMLKVEHGVEYLGRRFSLDPDMAEKLKAHPHFWAWWTELWAERDKQLLSKCERATSLFFGPQIIYTFPVGKEIKLANGDSFTQTETRRIPMGETWDFYKKYHGPERVKFYPNYVLINECLKPAPIEQ